MVEKKTHLCMFCKKEKIPRRNRACKTCCEAPDRPLQKLYLRMWSGARRRQIFWFIIWSKFKEMNLPETDCFYCRTYKATGFDRIDSSLYYTMDNVIPCCRICNTMKSDLTVEEFAKHVQLIAKNIT